jgi:tRNA(Ile)-lysidine synthase
VKRTTAGHAAIRRRIEGAVIETAARRTSQLVLAVSGGRDSMALLHAFARAARGSVAVVATFDHATGPAATRAAQLVAAETARLGLPVVIGRARRRGASEAEWRDARREFLGEVASSTGAGVATAHTRDDQVETVLMRVLRGAGARGLAGLYVGDTVRPLLDFSRDEVAGYAVQTGAKWVEDPTNESMRHFRNRVRRDLLPALARVSPGFDDALIALAREAREWREEIDGLVAPLARVTAGGASVSVAVGDLAPYSRAELTSLWPAIAARVGLAMDWRGTERAAAFTNESRTGTRIQLSGGWEIARKRDAFELRRWR